MIGNPKAERELTSIDGLLEGMCGGNPSEAIYRSEARGQRDLVESEVLPTEGSDDPIWAAWGVIFGEPVPGDEMFRRVTLPAGWRKVATDHSMWSNLVDHTGRVRAGIFYKAAFYDRHAHIRPKNRFSGVSERVDQNSYDRFAPRIPVVTDGGREVWRGEAVSGYENYDYAADAAARAWLTEHHPGWDAEDIALPWAEIPTTP